MGSSCSKHSSANEPSVKDYPGNQNTDDLNRDKGSSIIARGRRHRRDQTGSRASPDDDMEDLGLDASDYPDDSLVPGGVEISKGGSFVFSTTRTGAAGAWRPGMPIARPEPCPTTQFMYIRLDEPSDGEESPPQSLLQLTYGYSSLQGRAPKPPQKANQDSLVIVPNVGNQENVAMFGVFDGHGPRGEDASNFCRLNLHAAVTRQKAFENNPALALQESFPALHRELLRSCERGAVEMAVSGSTAVVIMLDKSKLVCANVGDSRALLCSYVSFDDEGRAAGQSESANDNKRKQANQTDNVADAGGIDVLVDSPEPAQNTSDSSWTQIPKRSEVVAGPQESGSAGKWVVTALSSDHKPNRQDEKKRILKSKARILAEAQLVPFGDPRKLYVCRESVGMIRYGVLFSRSIGDVDSHAHLGLISDAEVFETELERDIDRFLIVATDGVWDALTNDQAAAIVARYPRSDAQAACDALVEAAKSKWSSHVDRRRDDITAVVVGLKWVDRPEGSEQPVFHMTRNTPLPSVKDQKSSLEHKPEDQSEIQETPEQSDAHETNEVSG